MKKLKVLFWLFCFISCSTKQEHVTIITHVNVFDGENLIENTNLVFNDSVIVEITKDIGNYNPDSLIDGKNKTIIPPLLNAHVHVWQKENLKEAQKNGIFALLDMHTTDHSAWELRRYRDSLNYAFYYSAGSGATVPGGHGTQYGIPVPTINDSVPAATFVKRRIKNGADYIKILREPSFKDCISFTQTKEVIETAHAGNKLCVAHISTLFDAVELAKEKIDGFVHIWSDKKIDAHELKQFKNGHVFIVPTLYVLKKANEFFKLSHTDIFILSLNELQAEVKKVFDAGIPVLAGTDAPNFGFNYSTDLFTEMELLAQSGMPAVDVLKAATTNISTCFKLKEFGKLEKGKPASFILVDGNPAKTITDIKKHKTIWKKGKLLR